MLVTILLIAAIICALVVMYIKYRYHPYCPRLFTIRDDGGINSGVSAFFIIEWKPVFSIAFLKFKEGSREAYHSHAFNALTWWLKGQVLEEDYFSKSSVPYGASFIPKFTSRYKTHKVIALVPTYAITFRGPWKNTWKEFNQGKERRLTHGRVEIKS